MWVESRVSAEAVNLSYATRIVCGSDGAGRRSIEIYMEGEVLISWGYQSDQLSLYEADLKSIRQAIGTVSVNRALMTDRVVTGNADL